ncbi:MAG: M28 family peptidase, partial [Planctomycetes bacterium]|nr:M28 family peptidase [Planctomycetota bacterium]
MTNSVQAPPNKEKFETLAESVIDQAREIIETYGARPPGSLGERKAMHHIAEGLKPFADEPVRLEEFKVAPKAFFRMQMVGGVFGLLAVIIYWVSPAFALGVSFLPIVVQYFQLLRYRLFLDPFFSKTTSVNLSATLKPQGKIKNRIILNAHPDAAYEWRYNYLFNKGFSLMVAFMLMGMFLAPLICGLGWWFEHIGKQELQRYCGLGLLLFLPGSLLALFFNNMSAVVPGANDNLSGVFIHTAIFKLLSQEKKLAHTEVMVVFTGCEEAGLRGAKVWAKMHKKEFGGPETMVLTLDTIRDLDHMKVYAWDMNGTVSHDLQACRLVQEAGRLAGLDLPLGTIFLGSSDASAFTQQGFRCAALAAMDPAPAFYYHTRHDDWCIMDKSCIAHALEIV